MRRAMPSTKWRSPRTALRCCSDHDLSVSHESQQHDIEQDLNLSGASTTVQGGTCSLSSMVQGMAGGSKGE